MRLPAIGDVVAGNKYQIVRILGRGGMGVVYEATQLDLGRPVALKVFSLEVADDALVARFRREVSILARISHPHIVPIFDFSQGDAGTPPFLAMELLRGRTLSELVTSLGRLDAARATRIALQLLEALAAAHAQGVLHRDVKPANVFCVETQLAGDFVKLLDFGVAKELGAAPLTEAGSMVGTLTYMAPEVLRGEAPTYQTDVYAVGATLYYALSGKSPFSRGSSLESAEAILAGHAMPIEQLRPDTPPALAKVVARGLDVRTEERFASAVAMHEALAATLVPASDKLPAPPTESTLVSASPQDIVPAAPKKKKTKTLAMMIALLAFGVGGTGVVILQRLSTQAAAPAASTASSSATLSTSDIRAAAVTTSIATTVDGSAAGGTSQTRTVDADVVPNATTSTTAHPAAIHATSAVASSARGVIRYSGRLRTLSFLDAEECDDLDFAAFSPQIKALPWAKCFADAMFDPPLHQHPEYAVAATGNRVTHVTPSTNAGSVGTPTMDACVAAVARTLTLPRPASAGACHIRMGFLAECPQLTDNSEPACR